MDSTAPALSII